MEFIDENIQMDELCEELRQMHQMRIKNDVKVIFKRPVASLTIVSDPLLFETTLFKFTSDVITYRKRVNHSRVQVEGRYDGRICARYRSGIPAEKLNNVFGRFEKLDLLKQGFGLGLSICKSILDKMGGEKSG